MALRAAPLAPVALSCAQEQAGEAGATLDGEGCPGAIVHEDGGVLSSLQTPAVDVTTQRATTPQQVAATPGHVEPQGSEGLYGHHPSTCWAGHCPHQGSETQGPSCPRRRPVRPHLQLEQPLHQHRQGPATAVQARDGLQGPGHSAAGEGTAGPQAWAPPQCPTQSFVFGAAPPLSMGRTDARSQRPRWPPEAPTHVWR